MPTLAHMAHSLPIDYLSIPHFCTLVFPSRFSLVTGTYCPIYTYSYAFALPQFVPSHALTEVSFVTPFPHNACAHAT